MASGKKLKDLRADGIHQTRRASRETMPREPPARLEHEWIECWDPNNQRPYYFHRLSQEAVTWKPHDFVPGGTDHRCDAAVVIQCRARIWLAHRRVDELREARKNNLWVKQFWPLHKSIYYINPITDQWLTEAPPHFIGGGQHERLDAALAIQCAQRCLVARNTVAERRAMLDAVNKSGPLTPAELQKVIDTDNKLQIAQERLLDLKLSQAPDIPQATLALQEMVREAAEIMDQFSSLSPRSCKGLAGRSRIKAALDRVVAAGDHLTAAVEAANYEEDRQESFKEHGNKRRRGRGLPGLHVNLAVEREAEEALQRAQARAEEEAIREAKRKVEEEKRLAASRAKVEAAMKAQAERERAERDPEDLARETLQDSILNVREEARKREEAREIRLAAKKREKDQKREEARERALKAAEARRTREQQALLAAREEAAARDEAKQIAQSEATRMMKQRRAERRAAMQQAQQRGRQAFMERCNEWWQRGRELASKDAERRERILQRQGPVSALAQLVAAATDHGRQPMSGRGRPRFDAPEDYSSLWNAARGGCTIHTLTILLQQEKHRQWHHRGHRFHIDDRDPDTGENLLQIACWNGYLDICLFAIQEGASVHIVDSTMSRMTPLHDAARAGHADVVQALMDAGARVLAQDTQGDTCLHWAARAGRSDVVQVLLQVGPETHSQTAHRVRQLVNTRNHKKKLAMECAKTAGIAKLLEEYERSAKAADENAEKELLFEIRSGIGSTASRNGLGTAPNRLAPIKSRSALGSSGARSTGGLL